MAIEANITRDLGWFRHETKNIDIRVLDDEESPVDLASVTMEFTIRRQRGSDTVFLEKTPTAVAHSADTGGTKSVARIAVATSDYDDLEAGIWYYELWDRGNDALMAYGDVYLQDASAED